MISVQASDGRWVAVPQPDSAETRTVFDGQQIVFVSTADPNVFELRPVRLGPESDGRYQIIEGLSVGDKVVTNGSFSLRAEWLKGNQGAEHQH